jgi:hypothetical protein
MRAWMLKWRIPVMLLAGSLAGCQHAASTYPADPLLVSKKPIEVKPEPKPPSLVTYFEPEAPSGPVQAVASQPRVPATPSTVASSSPMTVRGQAP